MKIKYFSMFSGIGGFELGIQQALGGKAECVGFSEVDKHAISIYSKHFKEHKNYGDATKINTQELPKFDLLVGGFPCQAFSIAGKRRGFDDTRGTLFFEIARILEAKRPANFILENVKGLLSHNGGATFRTIIHSLDELGYDVWWQVLNSKDFGVPQNRERVFIVGHFRTSGRGGRKILLVPGANQQNTQRIRRVGNVNPSGVGMNGNVYSADGVSPTLTTNKGEGVKISLKQLVGGSQGSRVYDAGGLACTQASQAGGLGAKTGLYAIPTLVPEREKIRQSRRFKTDDNNAHTVCASTENGVLTAGRIRRLTPKECERLQGFPDDWTKYGKDGELMSDTQRYKCCGNAVTTNTVEWVIKQIYKIEI
jgi:DNA (cytosine-5)-methyltransferase 1